jgi:hypothetical protein
MITWASPVRLCRGYARGRVAHSGAFEEAVLKAIKIVDDRDTVGAVPGQVAARSYS